MINRVVQGAVSIIQTREPLSGAAVDAMHEVANEILSEGQPMAILDLSEVPLVNGLCLEALLDISSQFINRGGSLKLAAPNGLVSEILEITEVDSRLEVYSRVADAIGSFVR